MFFAAAIMMMGQIQSADVLKQQGFEVIEQIRKEYYLPKTKLYCEDIDAKGKQNHPAFNWGVGVMLSALNSAAKLDDKFKPWLKEYAEATRVYWNDKGPVPGYDVLPAPKPVDRYYDDNAWMVMSLVETYEVLGDSKYLDWAEQALTYVLSGWDIKLGGGIYWRESDKASKNTCSNAPSAAACLAVAKYRRKPDLVKRARDIMAWTDQNLRDPSDGLYWDAINLDRKIGKMKWTYNTGLPIRVWTILGQNAKINSEHLEQTIESAMKKWFDPETGAAKDEGKFAHLLFEGLETAWPRNRDAEQKIFAALNFLHQNVRNADGRYGSRWDRQTQSNEKNFMLINQASVARAYLKAALAFGGNPE